MAHRTRRKEDPYSTYIVKRAERTHLKMDRRKKVQWLLAYHECGGVAAACHAIHVPYSAYSAAIKEDAWFSAEKDLIELGEAEEVKQALYKRAKGMEFKETRQILNDKTGKIITLESGKYVPPDTEACKFILKNKLGEEFKDKHETDINLKTYEHIDSQRRKYGFDGPVIDVNPVARPLKGGA